VNWPREAFTARTVVVNRLGPAGVFRSGVTFGKLWRLFGNVSTTMCQSVMSTDSTISLRVAIVHHGRRTVTRLAIRKGRSVGVRPSILRSSKTKVPGTSRAEMRPMCSGR
jgi:hypothetical protein